MLLLSAAGIYALTSFTVNLRRREIGIRSALGAQSWRLVAGIFGRVLGRIGLGAAGGVAVALLVGYYVPVADMGGWEVPGEIPAAAVFVALVALIALLGPLGGACASIRSRNSRRGSDRWAGRPSLAAEWGG